MFRGVVVYCVGMFRGIVVYCADMFRENIQGKREGLWWWIAVICDSFLSFLLCGYAPQMHPIQTGWIAVVWFAAVFHLSLWLGHAPRTHPRQTGWIAVVGRCALWQFFIIILSLVFPTSFYTYRIGDQSIHHFFSQTQ